VLRENDIQQNQTTMDQTTMDDKKYEKDGSAQEVDGLEIISKITKLL
jgi:hypothetical protein